MPSSHADQQRTILGEATQEVISKPVPRLGAHCRAVRLSTPLQRIVDHTEVQFHPVDLAGDRGVAEAALVVGSQPRKTADALTKIWREVEAGNEWIVDADPGFDCHAPTRASSLFFPAISLKRNASAR